VDLLLHEVAVFAFFGGDRIERDGVDVRRQFAAVQRFHANAVARHDCHLPRFEEDHFTGVFQNRRDV